MMLEVQLSLIAVAGGAALTDWRTGRIPNWLTLPPIALAPVIYFFTLGQAGLLASLVGLFGCAAVPYLLFRRAAIGGGDVKLFAALGAIGGLQLGLEAELLGLGAASLLAIAVMTWRGAIGRTLHTALRLATNPVLPGRLRTEIPDELMTSMRLGTPIFIGTLCAIYLAGARW